MINRQAPLPSEIKYSVYDAIKELKKQHEEVTTPLLIPANSKLMAIGGLGNAVMFGAILASTVAEPLAVVIGMGTSTALMYGSFIAAWIDNKKIEQKIKNIKSYVVEKQFGISDPNLIAAAIENSDYGHQLFDNMDKKLKNKNVEEGKGEIGFIFDAEVAEKMKQPLGYSFFEKIQKRLENLRNTYPNPDNPKNNQSLKNKF